MVIFMSEEEMTTMTLSVSNWKELSQIKLDRGLGSLDEVLTLLLKKGIK